MLTGSDLLAKVKELGDVSKSDLVRACGYVSSKKNGGERLNFTAFYEALLEAKGVNLGESGVAGVGKGGRKLSYIATVQGNGNLLIGKAYTALLDLKAGDEFEIKLGRKLSYIATVQGNGNLLIGKAYTALLDLKAGDEFEIKLGRKQIRLLPTEES